MATIESPEIIQNIMDHKGWFMDEEGERDFMQAVCVYEYHNVIFNKISFCVCYSEADDIALRTSPAVGRVLMLWQRGAGQAHPIGSLRQKLAAMEVEI